MIAASIRFARRVGRSFMQTDRAKKHPTRDLATVLRPFRRRFEKTATGDRRQRAARNTGGGAMTVRP
ncbi:hypothetical protein, partial [Burkholderia thailandensis]|uniref:hypothetical protein n=1 Tax=Burkholderia thailandensis TaxID=57975 RepID=UPI0021C8DC16